VPAGKLRDRVAFDQRESGADDALGAGPGGFVERFTAAAEILPRFGGETVIASRLAGVQPATIKVRYAKDTAQVTPEWRLRDVRTDAIYNIKSIVDPDRRRQWLEILCETGKDDG
jgi:SPP1 family predicted phage head-tail adaptor